MLDGWTAGSASLPPATPTASFARSNGAPTGCTASVFPFARPRPMAMPPPALTDSPTEALAAFRPFLYYQPRHRLPIGTAGTDLHQPGATPVPRKQYRPRPVVSRAARTAAGAGGAAPMECRRGRPRGPGEAAQPLRNQRLADDHGVPRGAHAGGTAARRLPRFEQYRPHHPRRAAVHHRCARLPGLAGSSRATSALGILGTSLGSCVAFIAAAHDPRVATGHLQPRLDVLLRRGLDRPFHPARAPGLRRSGEPGRFAPLLGRDQPGQLICGRLQRRATCAAC